MTVAELFEKCCKNDGKGQRALYDLYKARLMGLCRRYSKDADDAKDILQETFVKIFSRITQVESAEKLESWMKSIAVRTAIDHYHKFRKPQLNNRLPEFHDVADLNYELILENLSDEYLIAAVNALPEGCRMVFNLFEIEGYSHVEIAGLLKITEGTSRSQLHHAKLLLKEKLSRLGVTCYERIA